jgi:uncharacterized protein (DUF2126 family)
MGGEPTFVSIDDMDRRGVEHRGGWASRNASWRSKLLLRLRDHFAPGACCIYGQGKWYPGEELPRWALGVFWRKDGEPLWRQPKLIAGPADRLRHDVDARDTSSAALCDLNSR